MNACAVRATNAAREDERLSLIREAYSDLDDIWEYTAADNPGAADNLREEIFQAISAVVPFPHQGHRRPDLAPGSLRFLVVREYLVAYEPDEKPLLVIGVIHGRRNPHIIASILRRRQ